MTAENSVAPEGNWDKPFLRSVVSEPDGTGSLSRVGILAIIGFSLVWATYLIARSGTGMPDFTGLTTFDGTMTGILYGVNKGAAAYQAKKDGE